MSDHIRLTNIAAEVTIPENGIISRTIQSDERTKVVLFGFDSGQELSEHTASVPAIVHVLSGEGTMSVGDDAFTVSAGAWIWMPANAPHSIHATAPLVMLLTMLRNP